MYDDIIGKKTVLILYLMDIREDKTLIWSIGIVKETIADGCILTNGSFVDRQCIRQILPDEQVNTDESIVKFFLDKKRKV